MLEEEGRLETGQNDTSKWNCNNYNNVINGENNMNINVPLSSLDGKEQLKVETQKDLIGEFMKVLSLAHMCVAEAFTNKNG